MSTVKYPAEIEIDSDRGVIYVHLTDRDAIHTVGGVTILRICKLPTPVPTDKAMDLTHMHGFSFDPR